MPAVPVGWRTAGQAAADRGVTGPEYLVIQITFGQMVARVAVVVVGIEGIIL